MKIFGERPDIVNSVIRSVGSFVACIGGLFNGNSSFRQAIKNLREKLFWSSPRLDASTLLLRGRLTLDDTIYRKMENIIGRMMNPNTGVIRIRDNTVYPIWTIGIMFSGRDMMMWFMNNVETKNARTKDVDLLYLAYVMIIYGYIYTIDGHVLLPSDIEDKFFLFQSPLYWYTSEPRPTEYNYAVYLVKRTLENDIKLKLDGYEKEYLKKLETIYLKDWSDIKTQAESELNRFTMNENKHILDTQERAFWDLHRSEPCFEVTRELDYDKIRNIKEISEWTVQDVMRSYENVMKDTVV